MNYIVSGSTGNKLASALAEILHFRRIGLFTKTFSDGETLLRFEDFPEEVEHAIVVQNLFAPQEYNLFQLLNICQGLVRRGVERLTVVSPYLCYARADREAYPGDIVSFKTVLNLMRDSGVSRLLTLDLHNPDAIPEDMGFDLVNLLPTTPIAEYFRSNYSIDHTWGVVAPDEGALFRARSVADKLGIDACHLIKNRDPMTGEVSYSAQEMDVHENIIMVDDITTSGSSIVKSSQILTDKGAKRVHVVISHLVNEEAGERINSTISGKFMATESIPSKFSTIDISQIIAEEIRKFTS